MNVKEWYIRRMNGEPMQKTRPIPRFPRLDLPEPEAPKTIGTAQEFKTFNAQHKQWPATNYGLASGMNIGDKAFVRGNIEPRRVDAIAAHEQMHQLFNFVHQKYGGKARKNLVNYLNRFTHPVARNVIGNALREIGYSPKDPRFNEEVLNYFHTYLTDPVNRSRIKKQVKSKWRQRQVDKHIKASWRKVLRASAGISAADLMMPFHKSIDDGEWKGLTSNHVPQYADVVDHQFHTVNGKIPKPYNSLLNHPQSVPSIHANLIASGDFPKLIHDVKSFADPKDPESSMPSNYVMVKPYHQKVDRHIVHYADKPIQGWATMATKALYHAGGLNHLIEDVTAAEHKGVPLTVHTFAHSGMSPIANNLVEDIRSTPPDKETQFRGKPNPLHVQQIGLMDYLTNNVDRHNYNLMVGEQPGEDGYNPILAIDHALSFQYNKTLPAVRPRGVVPDIRDAPQEYINRSGALRTAAQASPIDQDWSQLADWWKKNGNHMRKEFENQVVAIKHPSIREHIRRNFDQRWNMINDWASDNKPFNWQEMSIFDDYHPARHATIPIERADEGDLHALRSKLPANPYQAATVVAQEAIKYPQRKDTMNALTQKIMHEMSPGEFSNFLLNNYKHSVLDVKPLAHNIIFGGGQVKEELLQTFLKDLEQMPEEYKKAFPMWDEHFKQTPVMPVE